MIGPVSDEFGFALLIAGLLIFTVELRSRREVNATFKSHVETVRHEIRRTVEKGITDFTQMTHLQHLPTDMTDPSVPPIVRDVSSQVFSLWSKGLKRSDDQTGFEVSNIDWAIKSTEILYRILVESNQNVLHIKITHTGSPLIWKETLAVKSSLEQQKRLLEKLGPQNCSITRIFIGDEKQPLPEESPYKAAISLMKRYGIEARYVCDPNTDYPDVTWMPDLTCVTLWKEQAGDVSSIAVKSDAPMLDYLHGKWDTLTSEADEQERRCVTQTTSS